MLTSLNKDVMPFQCRCDNLTLIWSDIESRNGDELMEEKAQQYLKLAIPKTLRKVKSGSTRGFLPVCLDIVKGNDLTVSDTRVRRGDKSGTSSKNDQRELSGSNRHHR